MWSKLFLSVDIHVYKATNPELFSFLGRPLHSESSLWSHVTSIADFKTLKVRNLISGKKIFLVIDESDISDKSFFNILVDTIDIS